MKAQNASLTQSCVRRIKAVSDKIRWAVIEMLMDGPKTVGELAKGLGVEQSLLSHHLKILRHEGLIESRREGKSVICKLTAAIEFSESGWELDLGCCRLHKPIDAPIIPGSRPSLESVWLDGRSDKSSTDNRSGTKVEEPAEKPLISGGGGARLSIPTLFCQ